MGISPDLFVTIVGASGVGKTTLARVLCGKTGLVLAREQHHERPFQALFKQDSKYALANQMDYLLFRAEQERKLRGRGTPVLMDGGLDLDFHGFTRLFHARGFLTNAEFDLCRRFYEHTRNLLPPPNLVIHLRADGDIIRARLASRDRINIASGEDAELLEGYVNDWLENLPDGNVLHLDVSHESVDFPESVSKIIKTLSG